MTIAMHGAILSSDRAERTEKGGLNMGLTAYLALLGLALGAGLILTMPIVLSMLVFLLLPCR